MTYQMIEYTNDDGIVTVALNNTQKLNALNLSLCEELVEAAERIKDDKTVKAVILKGNGKAFSSGLDVMSTMKNPSRIYKLLKKPNNKPSCLVQDVAICWREIPVPVIACTHHFCLGGGLQIILGCDFRYSTADCKFSVLESKWGLIPDMGISITMRELVPIDVAKELTMSARTFDAIEAKELNLISKICDDPYQEALAFAHELKQKSPDALVAAKKLFNESWLADEEQALRLETKLQRKLIGSWNQLAASSRNALKKPLPFIKRKAFKL